jgi:hypothetical protein
VVQRASVVPDSYLLSVGSPPLTTQVTGIGPAGFTVTHDAANPFVN